MFKSPIFLMLLALCLLGCGRAQPMPNKGPTRDAGKQATIPIQRRSSTSERSIDLPQVDQKPGTAVVLLVDTSGSMKVAVDDGSGGKKPKNEFATTVMGQVVDTTDAYLKQNPVVHLEFGLFSFSSSVNECLKIGPFDRQAAEAGIQRVPEPNGGTAIGRGWSRVSRRCTRRDVCENIWFA